MKLMLQQMREKKQVKLVGNSTGKGPFDEFIFYVETAKVVRNKASTTSQDDTAAVETVPST